jgi:hypothetical protein
VPLIIIVRIPLIGRWVVWVKGLSVYKGVFIFFIFIFIFLVSFDVFPLSMLLGNGQVERDYAGG